MSKARRRRDVPSLRLSVRLGLREVDPAEMLRETALRSVPEKEGALLSAFLRELMYLWWETSSTRKCLSNDGSYAKADLFAVAKDLRHLAHFLDWNAEMILNDPTSTRQETRLGHFAEGIVSEIEAIVDRIMGKLKGRRSRVEAKNATVLSAEKVE